MYSVPRHRTKLITNEAYVFDFFDTVSISPSFDLSNLFEKDKTRWSDSRFMIQKYVSSIVSRPELVAFTVVFKVNYLNCMTISFLKLKSKWSSQSNLVQL